MNNICRIPIIFLKILKYRIPIIFHKILKSPIVNKM